MHGPFFSPSTADAAFLCSSRSAAFSPSVWSAFLASVRSAASSKYKNRISIHDQVFTSKDSTLTRSSVGLMRKMGLVKKNQPISLQSYMPSSDLPIWVEAPLSANQVDSSNPPPSMPIKHTSFGQGFALRSLITNLSSLSNCTLVFSFFDNVGPVFQVGPWCRPLRLCFLVRLFL